MARAAPARTQGASASALLDAIRDAGTISRVGLTRATGLTGATVSTVVRKLLDDELVVEIGRAESTGGKPRVLLELNQSARFAVGAHLDHSGITYAVTNLAGAPVARMSRPGPGDAAPAVVLARMAHEIDLLISGIGVDRSKVLGLGLASPGPLTSAQAMHRTPPFMRPWLDYPLAAELETLTGLPVLLENDATASAIGEYWSGGTDSERTFAALYMGTGIGAGIVLDGNAYRGTSGNAGEIGHICLDLDGPPCWCGMHGCTEVLAGPAAVVAAARADAHVRHAAGLDALGPGASIASEFAAVARASRNGVAGAREILERSARYVAVAAHAITNLLDVRMLVLTGSAFAAASHIYVPVIRDLLDSAAFARSSHPVDVRLSRAAETAGAIGGAAMVLQSELVPQRRAAPPLGADAPFAQVSELGSLVHTIEPTTLQANR
ncbi:Sugar kinase of the NBD/HSP70 family, may contain an N-terminal HTH domain [Sanguibacter gelidistatuariae]|uniref:Sugar kinase of the NBD/HSP70 family, may contain an N-terminal HTH domain n=1 Tax=Sanguibacter gelidistatuariae TaxID=1814289 RepID=A0A1G6VM15_9MICO|nr:ROK family transcriptional regulator [Sanguibacter gelidistatuariae]SDD53886.1 Sugar kinase of the NBD/HSP70 family, may contain an N-terminal HTH domain [Sanguibacter gelidistatuariae]